MNNLKIDDRKLLKALLLSNYFPNSKKENEELPPIFSTGTFSNKCYGDLNKLKSRAGGYDQVGYRLTRYNYTGRWLGIPHPLPYAKLCNAIISNWGDIDLALVDENSAIYPEIHDDGRVVIMNDYGDVDIKTHKILELSFGNKYMVNADIANCFGSIYTHAIGWALIGFEESKNRLVRKKDKNSSIDRIDNAARSCKRNETQGIAIGPGTSHILAELILSRIDAALRERGYRRFIRFIDDYKYFCKTEDEAQQFLIILELELAKFKLHLNTKKTLVEKLPLPISPDWMVEVIDIAGLSNQDTIFQKKVFKKNVSAAHIFNILDRAQILAKRHPEDSVLKFAVMTVRKNFSCSDDWSYLQYLLTLSFHYPFILPLIGEVINEVKYYPGLNESVLSMLETILDNNIASQRSDGICWSLYYLKVMKGEVTESIVKRILDTSDCMSMLTLYWGWSSARQQVVDWGSLLITKKNFQKDQYWPLLYQFEYDGVLTDTYPGDDSFKIMRQNKVNFLVVSSDDLPDYDDDIPF
jgi:hypothetical protein